MENQVVPRLINSSGEGTLLVGAAIRLGRAPDNQIVLSNDSCSRYHASITYNNGKYTLHDLSTYGTWVNGQKIAEQVLQSGDRIVMGELEFVFDDPAPTENKVPVQREIDLARSRLVVDLEGMVVKIQIQKNWQEHILQGNQWRLFALLYQNQGKVCTRDDIIRAVFRQIPEESEIDNARIDTMVSRLRRKLALDDPDQLPCILTMRGYGYKLII